MTIEEFIKELKPMTRYDIGDNIHYMGSTILTNQEMNRMLEVMLEDDYTQLNYTQRKKIRQRVFKEITDGN